MLSFSCIRNDLFTAEAQRRRENLFVVKSIKYPYSPQRHRAHRGFICIIKPLDFASLHPGYFSTVARDEGRAERLTFVNKIPRIPLRCIQATIAELIYRRSLAKAQSSPRTYEGLILNLFFLCVLSAFARIKLRQLQIRHNRICLKWTTS